LEYNTSMSKGKAQLHVIITAGPTHEPLDEVRRLTNFSTGSLGAQWADFLVRKGVHVTLLTGYYVTYPGPYNAQRRETFSTVSDLSSRLEALGGEVPDAVFHAAAVSDFSFGNVWNETGDGRRCLVRSGKFATRNGRLLAELLPTPKLIAQLRDWFPSSLLVGWKYEVEGKPESLDEKARAQLRDNKTDFCVLNGPAVGEGFRVFGSPERSECDRSASDRSALFEILWKVLLQHQP
jgi:phosphopantothenate---cysteine ligase (CTP)